MRFRQPCPKHSIHRCPTNAEPPRVSISTIRDFETGKRSPIANNLTAMQKAFEEAGIQFIPENGGGPGVRLRKRDDRPAIGAPPTVEEKGDVIGEP
jgi:hypothetical protein